MNSEPSSLDPRALRGTLGQFATGVTIVTAIGRDGLPRGITMSSFNTVSLAPPLVLFSIGRDVQSLDDFRQSPSFVVNILDHSQYELATTFGRSTDDKWVGVKHRPGRNGVPILDGSLAHFECVPFAIYEGGDHEIFVVEVVAHAARDGQEPLLFFNGRLRGLGEEYPATPDWHFAHYF